MTEEVKLLQECEMSKYCTGYSRLFPRCEGREWEQRADGYVGWGAEGGDVGFEKMGRNWGGEDDTRSSEEPGSAASDSLAE